MIRLSIMVRPPNPPPSEMLWGSTGQHPPGHSVLPSSTFIQPLIITACNRKFPYVLVVEDRTKKDRIQNYFEGWFRY